MPWPCRKKGTAFVQPPTRKNEQNQNQRHLPRTGTVKLCWGGTPKRAYGPPSHSAFLRKHQKPKRLQYLQKTERGPGADFARHPGKQWNPGARLPKARPIPRNPRQPREPTETLGSAFKIRPQQMEEKWAGRNLIKPSGANIMKRFGWHKNGQMETRATVEPWAGFMR